MNLLGNIVLFLTICCIIALVVYCIWVFWNVIGLLVGVYKNKDKDSKSVRIARRVGQVVIFLIILVVSFGHMRYTYHEKKIMNKKS